MKDMIVLLASVILGIFIFNLIAGDENSVRSELKKAWTEEVSRRQYIYVMEQ